MINFTYKANSATMPFPRQEEIFSSHVCLYRSSGYHWKSIDWEHIQAADIFPDKTYQDESLVSSIERRQSEANSLARY
jgi:hypothetical protein